MVARAEQLDDLVETPVVEQVVVRKIVLTQVLVFLPAELNGIEDRHVVVKLIVS